MHRRIFADKASFILYNVCMTADSQKRNYGIDALRILSMYMVVILHVLGCGGVLGGAEPYSVNYWVAWFLEIAAYCAVNVFAMISGFVMVNTKYNVVRMIPLWLTGFFYSVVITAVFKFIPCLSTIHTVTAREFLKSFLPVHTHQYWYLTAYFGMFFFIPFLNKMLLFLNKKEFRLLCVSIIVLFSLFPILRLKHSDVFNTGGGNTVWWLFLMYIIGAYFKLHPVMISKSKCALIYLLAIFITLLSKIVIHYGSEIFLKKERHGDLFIDYTSIFIIISAVALLLLFSQIKVENKIVRKSISALCPLAFSVYLIHVHPLVFNYLLKDSFSSFSSETFVLIVIKVLGISAMIFCVCAFIDLFRFFLFKILRIIK